MMRSMFSGVSGLRSHQTKMDVIANNISNVNTVGYKASRVTFKEVFTQTISGASAANAESGRGGTNPMQIGLGVNIGSIDNLMTQGAAQRTDNTTDLMIQGDNFFVVSDGTGTYFTRAGAFYLDEGGNLAMSGSDGLLVNGWYAKPETIMDENGVAIPTGKYVAEKTAASPISITGQYEYIEPETTTTINYTGNLNAVTNPVHPTTMSFFDSLGNSYSIDVKYEFNNTDGPIDGVDPGLWSVSFGNYIYREGQRNDPIYIGDFSTPDADGNSSPSGTFDPANPPEFGYSLIGSLSFNTNGKPGPSGVPGATPPGPEGTLNAGVAMQIEALNILPESTFSNINIGFNGMTQFKEQSNASSTTVDGCSAGLLDGISIDSKGIITGRYSNGHTRMIAQIATANFVNPAGLEKIGNNLYSTTINSGDFDGIGRAIDEGGGSFIVGSLEMSNVDLSSEFTEMITTQRGFQANSKIITTSDELLQELVNLKR